MTKVAPTPATPNARNPMITGRMPCRSISRPEIGPAKPSVRIESEIAQEIWAVDHPKSSLNGVIITPGAERIPAVTVTSRNVIATITQP